jgi:acetylornithine deacetylase
LGYATLHPGLINGGTAQSIIAAEATLNWERRTLPGETQKELDQELKQVVEAVESATGDHQVFAKQVYSRPPNQSVEDPLIRMLKEATGNKSYSGMSYWADSALAAQAGIPSVLFGPAGHGAHAIDEWVSESSMINCYESLRNFISNFQITIS